MNDQQPGDEHQAHESADEGVPYRSPASGDSVGADSARSGAQPGPAGGDHPAGGSPAGPAAGDHNQRMRQRLWKQLTGSPSRKAFTALFTAAFTAAVTAAVTVVVSGLFSSQPASPVAVTQSASGPPMQSAALGCPKGAPYPPLVDSVYRETALDSPGLSTAFPGKLNLSKSDLALLDKQGPAWLDQGGGYDIGATHIKLTLTGCQSVRILNMRAVILSRGQPLAGTIFQPAAQGGEGSLSLRFNLDSGSPVATMFDSSGHLFDYFERNTFTLTPHEQHTFEIIGYTDRSAITWELDVEFLIGNRLMNETIENGRRPFGVTAFKPPSSSSDPYSGYMAVYGQCYGWGGQPWPAVCTHVGAFIWVRVK